MLNLVYRMIFFWLYFPLLAYNFDRCQTLQLSQYIKESDPVYQTFFRAILLLSDRKVDTIVGIKSHQDKTRDDFTNIFEDWAKRNHATVYRVYDDELDFFKNFSQTIDFLYLSRLDTLVEIQSIELLLGPDSIIMIDDENQGKIIINYLQSKGWKISCHDHQAILVRELPDMVFQGNPFLIDFPVKKHLTNEDYLEIQNQLQKIDIEPRLGSLYPLNEGYLEFKGFWKRCARGVTQVLIDPEKGYYPSMNFVKIGEGGDNCIVSCVPYNDPYPSLIRDITEALQKSGFNGHFLYLVGGFPNPTGREIRYVGVPYSFKIFMMLEAQKRGFNKVLWLDSALLPLRDPTPLFNWIDKTGAFIHGWPMPPEAWNVVLPETRRLVEELTGVDVVHTTICCTVVFGLKMDTEKTKRLIHEYYQLAELGTPFLSCFPEEVVLMALIEKMNRIEKELHEKRKSYWRPHQIPNLFVWSPLEESEAIESLKNAGVYFYHRSH